MKYDAGKYSTILITVQFCIIVYLVWFKYKNLIIRKSVPPKRSIKKDDVKPKKNNRSWAGLSIIDKFVTNYSVPNKTPYIIAVCGGSGSGKTFISSLIAKTIKRMFPKSTSNDKNIVIISQDSYYIGGTFETNYDIPSAIDFPLLVYHLQQLISGNPIECPMYDFGTHSRKEETKTIYPGKIIIVEGILILTQENLRNLFNMKIFIHADEPTQIFRRAIRDMSERGRTIEEVKERYERDVWPSYKEHVLPSSKHADMSINNFNDCYVGPQIMLNHIITILRNIYQD